MDYPQHHPKEHVYCIPMDSQKENKEWNANVSNKEAWEYLKLIAEHYEKINGDWLKLPLDNRGLFILYWLMHKLEFGDL